MSKECHFYTSHYVASGLNYYYLGNATFIKLYIMILSQSQKDKISARLSNLNCPVCGKRELMFNEVPTQILSFPDNGSSKDFSRVSWIDCLCVHCLSCGYIMQFGLKELTK